MPDDKSKPGARDKARVAGGQDHEVAYFAKKFGIAPERARALIRKHGNDRKNLEAAVRQEMG